jgi:hypothetical protein
MDAGCIPEYPRKAQSGIIELPWEWCGSAAVDGAVGDWAAAPLGSRYTRIAAGNVVLYLKTARTAATGDWHSVTTS